MDDRFPGPARAGIKAKLPPSGVTVKTLGPRNSLSRKT
jgi:hypothetical protein